MTTDQSATTLEDEASRLGVVDALVFRRLSPSRWAHLGGVGRGRGWAGLVDVDRDSDPLLALVPAEPGDVRAFSQPQVGRVLGPYFAVGGALVRVSRDVVVILANPTAALPADTSVGDLRELAARLDASVGDISPAKRLGDELEILHAVRAVTTGSARDLAGSLRHVLDVALEALSCEMGLLRDGAGNIVAASAWAAVDGDDPGVGRVLDNLQERTVGGMLCIQDAAADASLAQLGVDQGVRSLLVLDVPAPVGGILLLAHTDAEPRGFTSLCRQLGSHLCDAAGVILHTATLRDELADFAAEQAKNARQDFLTGLGNRLAWDEALAGAQEQVDAGTDVAVVSLDLDGLKQVNDAFGHHAGDQLLVRCADTLRQHVLGGDVAVRLGGDEFALLLPTTNGSVSERVHTLCAALSGPSDSGCTGTVAAASLGWAIAGHGTSVADAAREADGAMYAAKRQRRVVTGR